jgi:hypothetical protein
MAAAGPVPYLQFGEFLWWCLALDAGRADRIRQRKPLAFDHLRLLSWPVPLP